MTLGRDFFFSEWFVEIFSTFEAFFRPEGRKMSKKCRKCRKIQDKSQGKEEIPTKVIVAQSNQPRGT